MKKNEFLPRAGPKMCSLALLCFNQYSASVSYVWESLPQHLRCVSACSYGRKFNLSCVFKSLFYFITHLRSFSILILHLLILSSNYVLISTSVVNYPSSNSSSKSSSTFQSHVPDSTFLLYSASTFFFYAIFFYVPTLCSIFP